MGRPNGLSPYSGAGLGFRILLRFFGSMRERIGVDVGGESGLWYFVQGDQMTRFLGLSVDEEGGEVSLEEIEEEERTMLVFVVRKGSLVAVFFERGDSRGGVGGRAGMLSRERRLVVAPGKKGLVVPESTIIGMGRVMRDLLPGQ